MRVALSRPPWEGVGSARRRSRMLSTDKFDAPQTSRRRGLGLTGVIEMSCLITSISVCVFPVPVNASRRASTRLCQMLSPGGPWIQATSTDSRANLTAAFWPSLSDSSKKEMPCVMVCREGIAIPRSTSTNRDRLDMPFEMEGETNYSLKKSRRTTASE